MATRDEAIQAIKDYPIIDKKIHDRREEILVPYNPFEDENIDGGRAQNVRNESLEHSVEQLEMDPVLKYLYAEEKAVATVLSQCIEKQVRSLLDKATYDIIYEFYLRETQIYNAEGIGKKVHLSRGRVYARKDAFIAEVQKELTKRDIRETNTLK
ncbi:hypothetical protein [Ligilactobacillus pobuzihii]|uniref:Transcriptional regulator n=1 Tax=Ligilactobacillus acidipiscis TaxID=89059 RepID=A0A921FAA8_9LACO|nr:hypothetical protein [Ligilactobacillus pobuzihii]HJE97924.1 hypothetical protein [Ligilactobacillus acidipiscis]